MSIPTKENLTTSFSLYTGEKLSPDDSSAIQRVYRLLNGFNDFTPEIEEIIRRSGRSVIQFSNKSLQEVLKDYDGSIEYIEPGLKSLRSRKTSIILESDPNLFMLPESAGKNRDQQLKLFQEVARNTPDCFGNKKRQVLLGNLTEYLEMHCHLAARGQSLFGEKGFGFFGLRALGPVSYGVIADFGKGLRTWTVNGDYADDRVKLAPFIAPGVDNLKVA